jgi:transposase
MNEHAHLDFWTDFLHLKGYHVVHVRKDTPDDPLRLTLVPDWPIELCPQCHRASGTIHRRSQSQPIRDLPAGTQTVELIVSTYQYECPHCGRFFTPVPDFWCSGAHATDRFLDHVADLVRISDIRNVAALLAVPERTLQDWYYAYVERQRRAPATPVQPIQKLGIDELHINTGMNHYVAVIIDHTNQRVLEVLENRQEITVQNYLEHGRDSGVLANVTEVTIDMWDAYDKAARSVFGEKVQITIDRFHVMKAFQDQLTAARREIQKQLPSAEAKVLKSTRWLLLTNQENLSPEEQVELSELGQEFPLLGQLRAQRDKLREVFEDPSIGTAAAGVGRLREWMQETRQLGLEALESFCGTLERWLQKIANYFVDRSSNGRVEGYNHGLRGILWRAFLAFRSFSSGQAARFTQFFRV